MNTYIILLRGINVGGKNEIPMKELKVLLEKNGFEHVKTYIQSGNVVFESISKPNTDIGKIIQKKFGFNPKFLLLSEKDLLSAVMNNPYQGYEGKFVHFYFCEKTPSMNTEKIEKMASNTENYQLIDNVFYLHAPEGIARSKLVVNIESCLGVSATGRNLNTVNKIMALAKNL